MKRRVVVTGMGVVTPLGNSVPETWDGIVNGRSGIRPIEHFDVSAYSTRFGGSIRDFDTSFLPPKEVRKFDEFILYGLGAAVQAMDDSGLVVDESNAARIGAAIGSGIGGIASIEKSHQIVIESGPRRISPFFVPGSITNMIAGYLSIRYGFSGPNLAVTTACTTGTHNIGLGARLIAWGEVDAMVVGGSEMATTPVGLGGFAAARALSTRNENPAAASRPWDQDRDGFVLSDGAGVLVLEELECARKRGARIHAEVIGFGMSGDACHMTLPPEDGRGASSSMMNAIRDAGIAPSDIDYINAHGTSTPAGDAAEFRAVQRILGNAAQDVAMSSTKSMIGHLLGAAGAVEAVFSILAIRDGVAPPTINLDNVDADCVLNCVPHVAQERKIDVALSNSFGFGGTNGSLIFRRF
ncbi:MAG: beta-ketoacyl-ACP synthase II [Gammaproteobacteria bacterium]|nr:beta-ketoacyl-ACP synthase II [Gammaproteobacteria bacterium]MBP6050653.1 beta-ketoacyl-ACP synthase II [Pseudomonadales bacterium]MBK7168884.1 beta-ketoacyl-ACP synthase II [Gammaproteobacteria bacterium]MBK7521036.1 beta-ketoacyl-ACP synthase II [Gammaproteobacteria bacterium]MBK7728813.1 beta-ketoacyl-ACP synthase II [Gammaproteobacteria bacterium]